MALDFSKYVDIDVESLEAPKPLPGGTYFGTITKQEPREVEYEKGVKNPVITIHARITGADEDVEVDLLPDGGGAGRMVNKDYRLNDPDKNGQWQLRRLGEETCRLPVKGLKLSDLLAELINEEVKIVLDAPKINEDGSPSFPRVRRFMSVHDTAED